jgi:biotin operon repressor
MQLRGDIPNLDNSFIWRAIEIMKEHGYDVDSIVTSGLSSEANPLKYHIVFAHK